MAVFFLSLRKRHGERRLSLFTWQQLAGQSHVVWTAWSAQLASQHKYPCSRLAEQRARMEREGGQGEGENGTELQGAKKNMCDNAKRGDFRNKRWGTVRDSGKRGAVFSIFGREGGSGALGLWGKPADIVGKAAMGWLTEWRRCRLIKPAASGIIY